MLPTARTVETLQHISASHTLIVAALVLLLGHWLVFRWRWLRNYNIPEPVAGGLLAAALLYMLHLTTDRQFVFDRQLQDTCMLMFFASIGLGADFARLRAGGRPLFRLLVIVTLFIILQNLVGVLLAILLGLKPLLGLVMGSITLTGGHGTAAAWGPLLETKYGVTGATTLGMATATFGLIFGGLIGGPVARWLLHRQAREDAGNITAARLATARLTPVQHTPDARSTLAGQPALGNEDRRDAASHLTFDTLDEPRLITSYTTIETLAMLLLCLLGAEFLGGWAQGSVLELPTFIWALACGILLRNILTQVFGFNMFDRAIDVFGNASLSLFLATALLNLKLWELIDLAGPVSVILAVQVVVMMLYAVFITYRYMGCNYDATVIAAGHCGFGLGATPTAIANMQAITNRHGPSYQAYLIVPLVGAFFVDLLNAVILQFYTTLPILH